MVGWLVGMAACGVPSPERVAPAFLAALDPAGSAFSGTVVEVVPAGGYRYHLVEDAAGDRTWVVSIRPAELGAEVQVRPMGAARDFDSPRTGRHFDHLLFAVVTTVESP